LLLPDGTGIGVATPRYGWADARPLRLVELGGLVGNLDYAVVSKAIARLEQRMRTDPQLREHHANSNRQCNG
jgi:hypothetical protein